jgi:hypothetical protein
MHKVHHDDNEGGGFEEEEEQGEEEEGRKEKEKKKRPNKGRQVQSDTIVPNAKNPTQNKVSTPNLSVKMENWARYSSQNF